MAETEKAAAKANMPKGGRKGGSTFPRIGLKRALEYSEKVVRKTHTGPQPEEAILRGVFENVGPEGGVRASALKQYGLLELTAGGFCATDLAKEIVAALPEQRNPLLQRAFLTSKLFRKIFDTHNGDTVSTAKIRQNALGLKVHLDSADECVKLFSESVVTAGLGTLEGESIVLVRAAAPAPATGNGEGDGAEAARREAEAAASVKAAATAKSGAGIPAAPPSGNKPGLAVTLNVDSSSDPDKLEKQLKLLRDYGVI
jgi:hypothetical protein